MEMIQSITLPKTESFYTKEFSFPVELVATACKDYIDPGPPVRTLPLSLDPAMQAVLKGYGKAHEACLADIAASAVQFFRTARGATEALDHIELRFLLTYDFGRVMTSGKATPHHPKRLGPASPQTSMRHGEAVKKTSEMFGYGLALHYVAKALGVPTDWFTFILGNGARPDFLAEQSIDELIAANPLLVTLGTSGQRIYVEVKARGGWRGMRETKDSDGSLLHCAKKAESCSDGILLSIVIALPKRSDSPRRTPRILVADPNSPPPLSVDEQAIFLLERYLFQAQRYGLDVLKLNILRWLGTLHALTDWQTQEMGRLEQRFGTNTRLTQPFLRTRPIDDQDYQGRYFYSLIERLGTPRTRQITIDQARAVQGDGNLGTKYFAGANLRLMETIARQDIRRLLDFGVRGRDSFDLAGKSAFREMQLELDADDRSAIRSAVEQALSVWQRTQIW
jgi:hypothetical protein